MPAPAEDLQTTVRHDIYPGIDPTTIYSSKHYKGKVVIVTGASKGIGESCALAYAKAGASLVLVSRKEQTLNDSKASILKEVPGAPIETITGDVAVTADVKKFVDFTIGKFGRLDIVVANAGLANPWDKPFTENDPDTWWKTVEVNIRGVFNTAHFALPHLDKTSGYFVIMSSGAAQFRIPNASNYCVSKHAVGRFNEFIPMEHPKVKSFAVHPGSIWTDTAALNPAWKDYCLDTLQLPAATILRLTSGKNDWLSGKFVSCNWDLDEVETKYKAKIIEDQALVSRLSVPL